MQAISRRLFLKMSGLVGGTLAILGHHKPGHGGPPPTTTTSTSTTTTTTLPPGGSGLYHDSFSVY